MLSRDSYESEPATTLVIFLMFGVGRETSNVIFRVDAKNLLPFFNWSFTTRSRIDDHGRKPGAGPRTRSSRIGFDSISFSAACPGAMIALF